MAQVESFSDEGLGVKAMVYMGSTFIIIAGSSICPESLSDPKLSIIVKLYRSQILKMCVDGVLECDFIIEPNPVQLQEIVLGQRIIEDRRIKTFLSPFANMPSSFIQQDDIILDELSRKNNTLKTFIVVDSDQFSCGSEHAYYTALNQSCLSEDEFYIMEVHGFNNFFNKRAYKSRKPGLFGVTTSFEHGKESKDSADAAIIFLLSRIELKLNPQVSFVIYSSDNIFLETAKRLAVQCKRKVEVRRMINKHQEYVVFEGNRSEVYPLDTVRAKPTWFMKSQTEITASGVPKGHIKDNIHCTHNVNTVNTPNCINTVNSKDTKDAPNTTTKNNEQISSKNDEEISSTSKSTSSTEPLYQYLYNKFKPKIKQLMASKYDIHINDIKQILEDQDPFEVISISKLLRDVPEYQNMFQDWSLVRGTMLIRNSKDSCVECQVFKYVHNYNNFCVSNALSQVVEILQKRPNREIALHSIGKSIILPKTFKKNVTWFEVFKNHHIQSIYHLSLVGLPNNLYLRLVLAS